MSLKADGCTWIYRDGKRFWTPHALVMYCIALRITLKSQSAVYFNAVNKIYPHATHAQFHPAQNRMFQQDDVPMQHIQSATRFLVLSY